MIEEQIYTLARKSYLAVKDYPESQPLRSYPYRKFYFGRYQKSAFEAFYDGTNSEEIEKLLKDIEILKQEDLLFFKVNPFFTSTFSLTFVLFKINLNKDNAYNCLFKERSNEQLSRNFRSILSRLNLLEMGCLPGNEVSLVQTAPFHDPLYLEHQRIVIWPFEKKPLHKLK